MNAELLERGLLDGGDAEVFRDGYVGSEGHGDSI
jgi:hypothetical protein